ncbi:MAG TPA: alkaline phosphatase family protein [Rhizomicrobium sp.]|nr:alkaline phosphatase family protein [Rhizomicrobium sp.]
MRYAAVAALTLCLALPAEAAGTRNVVIFVADGLRYASVTPETAPTMARVRREGVDFANSHAVFPTLTTANASAIATGHYLGDTGNYANTLYVGFPVACHGGAPSTFLEDDCVLREMKQHFPDDYLAQTTLMQAARAAGMNTILVGKKGPLAIQFLPALDSTDEAVDGPLGIFIDEATGHADNPDGSPTKSTMLGKDLGTDIAKAAGGDTAEPAPGVPDVVQQGWQRQAVTQVLIPRLKKDGKPFAMLYWSRDPDYTQHNAGDSAGKLVPGINSFTDRAAIYNADSDLKGILDALKQQGLDGNTDVFVIADHGFSTVARGLPAPNGRVERATLTQGFLAYDVAHWLGQKVFDPDRSNAEMDEASGDKPMQGSGLIGPSADAPQAVVIANGPTDFIYVPDGSRDTAKRIFDRLVQQPYVGGLFVNDALLKDGAADFAGALPMSEVNLIGSSNVPQPMIVVVFRTFVIGGCTLGEQMCAGEIADGTLGQGQGNHGSFSRADTRNFMAAIGPDFKAGFVDKAPVGNVDVTPTLAHILRLDLKGSGTLRGRVTSEALQGGKMPKVTRRTLTSAKATNGVQTVVNVEEVGSTRYFDAGGIPGRMVGLKGK